MRCYLLFVVQANIGHWLLTVLHQSDPYLGGGAMGAAAPRGPQFSGARNFGMYQI